MVNSTYRSDYINARTSEASNHTRVEELETLDPKCIAFAIIKPGFEIYEADIVDILAENDLNVVFSERMRLASNFIEHIYGEWMGMPFYSPIEDYLTTNDVTVMMISGRNEDAQKVLSHLKKTEQGEDGIIRRKFQLRVPLTQDEISLWGRGGHGQQDDVTIALTQMNVIHTADTNEEAIQSLRLLLGDRFDAMRFRGMLPSELYGIFED